jgi:tRNA-dihydrouridine synthase
VTRNGCGSALPFKRKLFGDIVKASVEAASAAGVPFTVKFRIGIDDALRMMAETGCDGVVVGRGCLGRPWPFGELEAAFAGRPIPAGPNLGEVGRVLRSHAELLVEHDGLTRALRDLRKHMAWYLMGFPVGSELRRGFALISTLDELDELIAQLDHDAPFPDAAQGPRGRQGSPGKLTLPHGWLDDPDNDDVPEAEDMHSGG